MEWKDQYGRKARPTYNDLLNYLPADIRALFLAFNEEAANRYHVANNYQHFHPENGWSYSYCRNYRFALLTVTIAPGCFYVLGVEVKDADSLKLALDRADEAYRDGYEERYARFASEKRAAQKERAQKRLARERKELAALRETVDPAKLNRFRWCKKLSRAKLVSLYRNDAMGLLDEELLDDVGYTFFARCKQAAEILPLMLKGKLLCHECGALLSPAGLADVTPCVCGNCYTYREYRRSFFAHNMPAGRAEPIFREFLTKWPLCKSPSEKMRLIDWLVHQCHVSMMSGDEGRSVCANLIEGTSAQLKDMLESLAGH